MFVETDLSKSTDTETETIVATEETIVVTGQSNKHANKKSNESNFKSTTSITMCNGEAAEDSRAMDELGYVCGLAPARRAAYLDGQGYRCRLAA